MASEFIGYNVLVTLRAPPNATVQGVVANVIGQRLMLRDVTLSWSHQKLPTYSLDAPDIADLSLGPTPKAAAHNLHTERENQTASRGTSAVPAQKPFVDPAILSFSKPPSDHGARPVGSQLQPTPIDRLSSPTSQNPPPPQKAHCDQSA
ncbi:enhancer of mRNA decapping, partial [Aspergillus hancockii]